MINAHYCAIKTTINPAKINCQWNKHRLWAILWLIAMHIVLLAKKIHENQLNFSIFFRISRRDLKLKYMSSMSRSCKQNGIHGTLYQLIYSCSIRDQLEALGQCTPPPRHVLPVSRYRSGSVTGSPPKFNHLFIGQLLTFSKNLMQIHLEVFAQSC